MKVWHGAADSDDYILALLFFGGLAVLVYTAIAAIVKAARTPKAETPPKFQVYVRTMEGGAPKLVEIPMKGKDNAKI